MIEIKNIKKILGISIVFGFILEFIFSFIAFSAPSGMTFWFFEWLYGILNYLLPILVLILFSIILFSSKWFQNIWQRDNLTKKIFSFIGNIILAIIISVILWGILIYIGFLSEIYGF